MKIAKAEADSEAARVKVPSDKHIDRTTTHSKTEPLKPKATKVKAAGDNAATDSNAKVAKPMKETKAAKVPKVAKEPKTNVNTELRPPKEPKLPKQQDPDKVINRAKDLNAPKKEESLKAPKEKAVKGSKERLAKALKEAKDPIALKKEKSSQDTQR